MWNYYSFNGKISETGYYKNGTKTGTWTAYDVKSGIQLQYDFTNNTLLAYKPTKDMTGQEYGVINGKDTIRTTLQRPPIYLDGDQRFFRPIMMTMHYPARARQNHVRGTVIVSFVVNINGKASDYKVRRSIGYGCDEEALKAIKLSSGDWLPGILNGKPVTVECYMPLSFNMN